MSDSENTDDRTPEERFAIHINQAMALAVRDDADLDQVARICINTARELYDHYGVREDYARFVELVVDAGFESAEVEAWLNWMDEHGRESE